MNGEGVGVGGKNHWIIRGVKKEEEKKNWLAEIILTAVKKKKKNGNPKPIVVGKHQLQPVTGSLYDRM